MKMPRFLGDEIEEYLEDNSNIGQDERMFKTTKYYLAHEMKRSCAQTDVKRIRIHDLRRSYVSLLIDMGFSALAIAEWMGYKATDITFRYAHLFLNFQDEMTTAIDASKEDMLWKRDVF